MWCDILNNIISDLIAAFFLFVFWFVFFLLTKRRKLLNFFGCEESKKLTIYTSNLIVEKFGSSGLDRVRYSFQGTAIPYEESKAAAKLQTLFNYFLPSQIEKPGLLSKILISDVDVKVLPAPTDEKIIEQNGSVITLGFPPYNLTSRYTERTFNPAAKLDYIPLQKNQDIHKSAKVVGKFIKEISADIGKGTATPLVTSSSESIIPSGIAGVDAFSITDITSASAVSQPSDGESQDVQPIIRVADIPPFTDPAIGFVQKIISNHNRRNFFYIAGLSESSTAGSAYYLINNWEKLARKYGYETPFLVMLRIEPGNNGNHVIILERSIT